jgi:membrane protease YdiL (CAAX protease family)
MPWGTIVAIDPAAFEAYRAAPSARSSLPRLGLGLAVIGASWMAGTVIVLAAGSFLYRLDAANAAAQDFLTAPVGVMSALASFIGIWIGVAVAERFVHRGPPSALLGNGRRISWNGFAKGFAAVAVTSLLSEIALYALWPGIERSAISPASWLLFLVPVVLLAFVQISAEEILFRAYLPRHLAARFRSPWAWGLPPLALFTALHWSASSSLAINLCILATIGAFALVLMLTVYATGNLGAAFGAHLGNNLFGFLLISHQQSYNAFALFTARPLEGAGWSGSDALLLAAIGIVASGLTALLLLHPRSPLKIEPDRGKARDWPG